MIGILNYGLGTIYALKNIFDESNINVKIISKSSELTPPINKLIIPGVGSYDNAIRKIKDLNFFEIINNFGNEKRNFILGICVGMQILGDYSEEGSEKGLQIIPGSVIKFSKNYIVPNMGWNKIKIIKENELFKNINENDMFYFLHSYYFKTSKLDNILCYSKYYHDFPSVIYKNNIFGIQFHPEKSHSAGKKILINFNNLT